LVGIQGGSQRRLIGCWLVFKEGLEEGSSAQDLLDLWILIWWYWELSSCIALKPVTSLSMFFCQAFEW
jgi:hypothetical protein